MSSGDILRVSVVCEGDTDYLVIEAVLASILDEDFVCTMIQPEQATFAGSDFGEMGPGWTGVRNWCEGLKERYGDLESAVDAQPLAASHLLVLHVDADIAAHSEIDVEMACPPAWDTVRRLRDVVLGWGGTDDVPPRVVLCIPSKAVEAWVLCALHPENTHCRAGLECRAHPESLLVGKPDRLVRRKGRRYAKSVEGYREVQDSLSAGWGNATGVCGEAKRFEEDVAAALPS